MWENWPNDYDLLLEFLIIWETKEANRTETKPSRQRVVSPFRPVFRWDQTLRPEVNLKAKLRSLSCMLTCTVAVNFYIYLEQINDGDDDDNDDDDDDERS